MPLQTNSQGWIFQIQPVQQVLTSSPNGNQNAHNQEYIFPLSFTTYRAFPRVTQSLHDLIWVGMSSGVIRNTANMIPLPVQYHVSQPQMGLIPNDGIGGIWHIDDESDTMCTSGNCLIYYWLALPIGLQLADGECEWIEWIEGVWFFFLMHYGVHCSYICLYFC